ncbi:MAG: hypothetical protein KC486_22175 [Myxococcales bacterium]|nr:hypothetical protein [Myxococcales bacterium]
MAEVDAKRGGEGGEDGERANLGQAIYVAAIHLIVGFALFVAGWVMLVVVALPSTGGAQPYVVAGAAMAIGMAIAARAEGYFVAATKHLPALRDTPAYLRRLRSNDELSSAGDRR